MKSLKVWSWLLHPIVEPQGVERWATEREVAARSSELDRQLRVTSLQLEGARDEAEAAKREVRGLREEVERLRVAVTQATDELRRRTAEVEELRGLIGQ